TDSATAVAAIWSAVSWTAGADVGVAGGVADSARTGVTVGVVSGGATAVAALRVGEVVAAMVAVACAEGVDDRTAAVDVGTRVVGAVLRTVGVGEATGALAHATRINILMAIVPLPSKKFCKNVAPAIVV